MHKSRVKISLYCKNRFWKYLPGGILHFLHFSDYKVGNNWAATAMLKGIL